MKKNVLITGAAGGIGKSICMSLLKKYNLILVGRNKKNLDSFISDHQSVIKRITCDLRDKTEIKKMYENIVNDGLQVDILINNAGLLMIAYSLEWIMKNGKSHRNKFKLKLLVN